MTARKVLGMIRVGQHDQQSMMGSEAIWQRFSEALPMVSASRIMRNEMKRFWEYVIRFGIIILSKENNNSL